MRILKRSITNPPEQHEIHRPADGAQDRMNHIRTRLVTMAKERIDGGNQLTSTLTLTRVYQRDQELHSVGRVQSPDVQEVQGDVFGFGFHVRFPGRKQSGNYVIKHLNINLLEIEIL